MNVITQRIEEDHKLLDDASTSWQSMDEIDDLVIVHDEIQETQKEVDTIFVSIKALLANEKMLKMGEKQKLQEKITKLCREEAHYLKIVQPWQEEVSQITIKVNEKLMKFKDMQTTVVSLQEELVSTEMIDSTRECAEQFKNDLAELQTSFIEFSVRVIIVIQEEKEK